MGAIVAYEWRQAEGHRLPSSVRIHELRAQPSQAGMLDAKYGPLNLDTRGGDLSFVVPQDEKSRFERRILSERAFQTVTGRHRARNGAGTASGLFRADALGMMESPEIPKILKMDDSDKKRYGDSGFGDACILARNILGAERGARFVAINHGAWDLHTNIYDKAQKSNQYTLSRDLDTGLSELIADMGRTKTADGRTLLEKTLIVCLGEFAERRGSYRGQGKRSSPIRHERLIRWCRRGWGACAGCHRREGGRVVKPGLVQKQIHVSGGCGRHDLLGSGH